MTFVSPQDVAGCYANDILTFPRQLVTITSTPELSLTQLTSGRRRARVAGASASCLLWIAAFMSSQFDPLTDRVFLESGAAALSSLAGAWTRVPRDALSTSAARVLRAVPDASKLIYEYLTEPRSTSNSTHNRSSGRRGFRGNHGTSMRIWKFKNHTF